MAEDDVAPEIAEPTAAQHRAWEANLRMMGTPVRTFPAHTELMPEANPGDLRPIPEPPAENEDVVQGDWKGEQA